MSILSEKFDAVRVAIMDPLSPAVHYPLLEILSAANNNSREFNRAALSSNGIDPDIFRTAWATGFAKETLAMHGQHPIFKQVELSRCQTCLDTSTLDSFGHYISDDLRAKLTEKQKTLAPHYG